MDGVIVSFLVNVVFNCVFLGVTRLILEKIGGRVKNKMKKKLGVRKKVYKGFKFAARDTRQLSLLYGLVARIPVFHTGGPGSIPGGGKMINNQSIG